MAGGHRGVDLSDPAASRLVDVLTLAGLVERTVPPHGRHEVSLTLSAAGSRVVRRHHRVRRKIFAELLGALEEQERAGSRVTGERPGPTAAPRRAPGDSRAARGRAAG